MAEIRIIETDGFAMRCGIFGSGGKSLVFLPGLTVGHVTDQTRALERRYRDYLGEFTFYLFDRREDMPEGYTMAQMAGDTVTVIRALGLDKIYVFGASQGAMMALSMAERYPDLVERMVLGSGSATLPPVFLERCRTWLSLAEQGDSRGLYATFLDWMFSEAFLAEYRSGLMRLAPDYTPEELLQFRRQTEAFYSLDVERELGSVRCPTLVLGAEKDAVFTADASRHMASELGCECYIYPGMGHAVYDEAEDYTRRMMGFMLRQEG